MKHDEIKITAPTSDDLREAVVTAFDRAWEDATAALRKAVPSNVEPEILEGQLLLGLVSLAITRALQSGLEPAQIADMTRSLAAQLATAKAG